MTPLSNGYKVIAWKYGDDLYSPKGNKIGSFEQEDLVIQGDVVSSMDGDALFNLEDEEVATLLVPSSMVRVSSYHDVKSLRQPVLRSSRGESRTDARSFLREIGEGKVSHDGADETDGEHPRKGVFYFLRIALGVLVVLVFVDYLRFRVSGYESVHEEKVAPAGQSKGEAPVKPEAQSTTSKPAPKLEKEVKPEAAEKAKVAVPKPVTATSVSSGSKKSAPAPKAAAIPSPPKQTFIDRPLQRINDIGHVDVYESSINTQSMTVYQSGMAIDADGSPRAYGPAGTQPLDYLEDAGHPGNWWGVVTNALGEPVVQRQGDPYPGYYVSTTALQNFKYGVESPYRYVNSEKVAFLVVPPREAEKMNGIGLADLAVVWNRRNDTHQFCIVADIGPRKQLGEGSVYLADKLGINSNAKTGGQSGDVVYFIFPKSGDGKYMDQAMIDADVTKMLKPLGGVANLKKIWQSQTSGAGGL
ncbi:glycoside hydrolase family 75 protein [Rubritalea halochordaticola]|uniref:glycoside hydrolase family 75 protein n=1 Tax=Rubritalea halochordaticola TaxID=714537 RepID=UPI0031FCF4D6